MKHVSISLALLLTAGCLSSVDTGPTSNNTNKDGGGTGPVDANADPTTNTKINDTITYRDLASHPGCATEGLETRGAGEENGAKSNNMKPYKPAQIPGYRCAAKEYPVTAEDKSKPIVLLVHGNSSTPSDWEAHPTGGTPMLSERLVAAGYKTFAVDFRYDKVDDPTGPDTKTGNPAKNMDHGWCTPIAQHFFESMFKAYPDRQFAIVSFSLGPTVVRDALRRLHRAGQYPYTRIAHLVYAAGAHHGVSSFRAACGSNPTMRGKVACEMGDRTAWTLTDFLRPLNGEAGAADWEAPCADGKLAFGQEACKGHAVKYTTVTMADPKDGTYQDEFVSEAAARLNGADNKLVQLTDIDTTNYFYNGLFKSHYGAVRSENGVKQILEALAR
jgi:hypothetical protein